MFCCALLYVHSSIAIILMGKRELVALLNLSSWCLVMVERLFLAVPLGCLRFVIVVFPDHTHLLFFMYRLKKIVGSNNFSAQFIELFLIIKRLAKILMYCNRLRALWSTQSWLATLLSYFIARPQV